jgi:hypothetical protein
LFSASGPALSNGTGISVEAAAGPRRTEGRGEVRRGQRRADRFRRISISHAATKATKLAVVGRLLDRFDKDASSVSALQHSSLEWGCASLPPSVWFGLAACDAAARFLTDSPRNVPLWPTLDFCARFPTGFTRPRLYSLLLEGRGLDTFLVPTCPSSNGTPLN